MFVYCEGIACVVNVDHIVAIYVDGSAVVAELDLPPGKQPKVELGYYDTAREAQHAFDELVIALDKGEKRMYRMLSLTEVRRELREDDK